MLMGFDLLRALVINSVLGARPFTMICRACVIEQISILVLPDRRIMGHLPVPILLASRRESYVVKCIWPRRFIRGRVYYLRVCEPVWPKSGRLGPSRGKHVIFAVAALDH